MGEIRTFDQAFRRDFGPYLDRENATAFLSALLDRGVDRKVLYHLEICNISINNGKEIFKRIPPEVLEGFVRGGQKNVEASFVARADEGTVRPYQARVGAERLNDDTFKRWDRQEYDLESWARRDGCWSDDILADVQGRYGKEIARGTEARVFREDPNHVLKIISAPFDVQETLDRIALNNFVFGDPVSMELVGLGRNADNEFCFLVRQQFITGSHVSQGTYAIGALDGFREYENANHSGKPDYVTDRYIVGDLHDRNVLLTPEGNLAVVDCNIFLNTPDLGMDGRWQVPDVEYDEDSVSEMAGILYGLLPKSMDMETFLCHFDDAEGTLRRQLQSAGRIEGTVSVPMKDGTTQDICVAADPEDRKRIIYNNPSKINTLVKYDARFSSSERKELCNGRTVRQGDSRYFFNLDKGRVEKVNQRTLKQSQTKTTSRKKGMTI